MGYPVAVKLRSPDIRHKSDVQGVMLNLRTGAEVANAAQAILDRVSVTFPHAHIQGLLIQSMAPRAGAQELRVTISNDPVFGTIILLGEGGSDWDVTKDAAVAIPPLNMTLARYLVIGAIKDGKIKQRGFPVSIDVPSLCRFLVTLSQMIIDCPEVDELDIHPLLVAGEELTILDASLRLRDYAGSQQKRLAIRPYPKELEQSITLKKRTHYFAAPYPS